MSTGVIKKVAGPLVIAEGMRDANMFDVVRVSEQRLIGEIIEMHGDEASIQVYEETSGLGPGEPVESMDVPMSVELGPGLIASIYDGIQRPLDDIMKISGNNLKRGVEVPSLKRNLKWEFVPTVKVGDEVETGDVIGTVQETVLVQQKIMVPYGIKGTIKEIKEGTFTVEDIVAVVETEKGEKELTMMQKWPVRRGRPYKKKLPPEMPLVTGQRVIDTFFPIAKGGVAAVPGPFGSGKTVIQHQLAKWAEAGYISEDEVTKTTTDTTTQTQDWGISWWTDIPVNAEANSRYNQEVVMTPITDRWAHSTSALGSCYAVTANSTPEEAQACVDFLGLLYTDSKLADLYTFGIEGEDFNYVDGKVEQTDAGKYNHSMWESASATIVTPLTTEPDDKAELYKEFNGGANTSCAAGFRFDKNEVADKYAACQNVFNEYGFALENGGYGVDQIEDTIAQYQAALDEAGYQDVLAAFQAQYDEWKAENGSETTDESVEEESSSVAE